MTQSDLVDLIAAKSGISKKDTGAVLTALVGAVSETLKKGDDVRINGLGIFSAVNKPARKGRNPATGAEIDIAASTKASFKAFKPLNDALKA